MLGKSTTQNNGNPSSFSFQKKKKNKKRKKTRILFSHAFLHPNVSFLFLKKGFTEITTTRHIIVTEMECQRGNFY